jgi:hypothetical protein
MKRVSGEDIHEISPTVGFNIKSKDKNQPRDSKNYNN